MINVISGGQREEYEKWRGWKELHECDVSLAWPITDWLLSETSCIDWSAANLMEQGNRSGKLHEDRARASGLSLDMWGLAYDASINARFVDDTSLRANTPSAIALFNRCRGEYERRWNNDVWQHLEASHRELQRAWLRVQRCRVVAAMMFELQHLLQCCTWWLHWKSGFIGGRLMQCLYCVLT